MALPFNYRKGPPRTRPSFIYDESGAFPVPHMPDDVVIRPNVDPIPEQPVIDPSLLSVITRSTGATRPREVASVTPPPVPVSAPSAAGATRPRLADIGESPWSVEYENGRPTRVSTSGTGPEAELEAQRALKRATQDYIPQAQTGWKRFLQPALRYAAGVAARGGTHPGNMAGAAIVGGLEGLLDPKAADKRWKTEQQAKIDDQTDKMMKQRREAATVANLEIQPELKRDAVRQRQQGLDTRDRRVDDLRVKNALDYYNKIDYEPGKNPELDQYFAESGLHSLPPRVRDDTYQLVWESGQLLRVPKRGGEAAPVTVGGKPVVDRSKAPTETVVVNGVKYDHLTPREAAILQGRISESEKNRASRERIAAAGQAGQDRRTEKNIKARGAGGAGGVLNPSLRAAIVAVSKFRSLTTQIERARSYGDNQTADALQSERDGHERTMRSIYGDMLQNDDKGKPTIVNPAYTNPPGEEGEQELTIEGAIEYFRKKHGKEPTPTEVENMRAALLNP